MTATSLKETAHWRTMLPLYGAVFIDLFSFGLMYPVIVALFAHPSVVQAYGQEGIHIRLSLAFSLVPLGMFFGTALLGDLSDAFGRRRTLQVLVCEPSPCRQTAVDEALVGSPDERI
jgi:DHA1 family tetracycline resistance protein-like MFS transporter